MFKYPRIGLFFISNSSSTLSSFLYLLVHSIRDFEEKKFRIGILQGIIVCLVSTISSTICDDLVVFEL